jgi:hypothetical protein
MGDGTRSLLCAGSPEAPGHTLLVIHDAPRSHCEDAKASEAIRRVMKGTRGIASSLRSLQ